MTREKFFNVAGHFFTIQGEELELSESFPLGFRFFEVERGSEPPLFSLQTGVPVKTIDSVSVYSFQFEELDISCEFGSNSEFYEFRMTPSIDTNSADEAPFVLKMPRGQSQFSTNLFTYPKNITFFNFLLWNAFGVASAPHRTIAIHSSVIIYQDQAVLFLGESGTGKSTHTQLWLQQIQGSKLLNDDSPLIRIIDQNPLCFGSPWSGKGNCYWNLSFPIAAIVRLRQAPFNKIRKLNRIEAFQAVYPSCPPSFSIDSDLTDHICNTLSSIIEKVPVYLMDCLPNEEAALLSCSTIFSTVLTEK